MNGDVLRDLLRAKAAFQLRAIEAVIRDDSAADWLIRVGPLAKRLNEESRHDGDGQ